jgi:4-hydroxybenzoate polyprenyltransferase
MRVYFREMFPPAPRLGSAALLYASFTVLLARIHGVPMPLASPLALLGVWNVFALLLVLRLMDELKDRDVDLALFKERPVPSGRVRESDIKASLAVLVILYLGANAATRPTFLAAAVVLGYAFLMFKYFFFPDYFRAHLLPNLASHNPIVALLFLQIVVLFSVQTGLGLRDIEWLPVLLAVAMNWAMFLAWEISRKIRAREEENAYVTYSRIFGRAGATAITGGAQTVTLLLGFHFSAELELAWVSPVLLAAGYLVTAGALLRFAVKPNRVTSKLRPFAEAYIFSVLLAILAGGLLASPP